jgi:hypothetical protein
MKIKCGLGLKWAIKQISKVVPMHIMQVYKGLEVKIHPYRPVSLPGRVPTAHGTTGCVGPRADLETLKIEQFFAVAGDQHTVSFLSN